MPRDNDQDAEAFLRDIEARRGAPIIYRTFSTFYGDNRETLRDYGVFFYQVNDEFWFEDFEREPNFLGFKLRTRKDAPKYERFESSFKPVEVKSVKTVTKRAARNCIVNQSGFEKLKAAIVLRQLFSETVTEITMNDGRIMYFQFMDKTVRNKIQEIQGTVPGKGV